MKVNDTVKPNKLPEDIYPSSYREVKKGKTLYCVTSVFTGEKELGPTLEKLAARKVLEEMDARTKETLRNG